MHYFPRAFLVLFFFGLLTACGGGDGGGFDITQQPFTREREDGKIPVKPELIRRQVRAELAGIPEGEAKVLRWQQIETDYHACRLASDKVAKTEEKVFADCMAGRGYVYMYRIDAEQLHNDIAFEMEKANREGKLEVQFPAAVANPQVVTATVAISPPPVTIVAEEAESDSGGYAGYLLGLAAAGGIVAAVAGGGGGGDGGGDGDGGGNNATTTLPPPSTTLDVSIRITPQMTMTTRMTMNRIVTVQNERLVCAGFIGSRCFEIRFVSQRSLILVSSQTIIMRTRVIGCPTRIACDTSAVVQTESMVVSPIITTSRITTFTTMAITLMANAALKSVNQISYSPDMRRVVHAAIADTFRQGIGIGESGFAFSGRYDGDNRAAGFTYDFGDFALRTDYARLPSKQDGAVFLDTYRLGIVRPINDEARFFAGIDSYRNAIFAIDTNGDNQHRLGVAIGDGYAVKYEYRLNL